MIDSGFGREISMRLVGKKNTKEKKERSLARMENFRDCLAECKVLELGYQGYTFTWNNKHEGDENVQVQLDRATCNDEFQQIFPLMSVQHVATEESDHMVLVIRVAN